MTQMKPLMMLLMVCEKRVFFAFVEILDDGIDGVSGDVVVAVVVDDDDDCDIDVEMT